MTKKKLASSVIKKNGKYYKLTRSGNIGKKITRYQYAAIIKSERYYRAPDGRFIDKKTNDTIKTALKNMGISSKKKAVKFIKKNFDLIKDRPAIERGQIWFNAVPRSIDQYPGYSIVVNNGSASIKMRSHADFLEKFFAFREYIAEFEVENDDEDEYPLPIIDEVINHGEKVIKYEYFTNINKIKRKINETFRTTPEKSQAKKSSKSGKPRGKSKGKGKKNN